MVEGHKIKKKVKTTKYLAIIKSFDESQIKSTDHTFFRLSEEQRKIFKHEVISDIIRYQDPILVGIQYNRLYAVFHKHEKDVLRIMLDIQATRIQIVTFYVMDHGQLPRI